MASMPIAASVPIAFDWRGTAGFDFARLLGTDIAIEAFDQLMRDARALIGRQRERLFQNPRGVSHCGSLSHSRSTCQGPQAAAQDFRQTAPRSAS
jgi:hypothetical protein